MQKKAIAVMIAEVQEEVIFSANIVALCAPADSMVSKYH